MGMDTSMDFDFDYGFGFDLNSTHDFHSIYAVYDYLLAMEIHCAGHYVELLDFDCGWNAMNTN